MKFILVIDQGAIARFDLTLCEAIDQANEYWAEHGDTPICLLSASTGVEVTKFRILDDPREQLCELSYYKTISCS